MTDRSHPDALSAASEFFYSVCELYEDEDLDPEDHLEVLKRAFRSSDCDDFAAVLSRLTGWPVATMIYPIPDYGMGHHTLVRSPDGRLLDVGGWTDEKALRKIYGIRSNTAVTWAEGHISSPMYAEEGEEAEFIEGVIRHLPYAPFHDDDFRELAARRAAPGMDPS
jgi:hypothetical protein